MFVEIVLNGAQNTSVPFAAIAVEYPLLPLAI